jgi:hypothetical protein
MKLWVTMNIYTYNPVILIFTFIEYYSHKLLFAFCFLTHPIQRLSKLLILIHPSLQVLRIPLRKLPFHPHFIVWTVWLCLQSKRKALTYHIEDIPI